MSEDKVANDRLVTLTADIVAAHVSNNFISSGEMPNLIENVYSALSGLGSAAAISASVAEPAVPIRASVKPDYLICLEDGKKLKMLKRYLRTNFKMTPDEYRSKWNLPHDYPMIAPNYAAQRKALAIKSGLGRKPTAPSPSASAARARKPKLKLEYA